ncbi:MAG: elongation factor P maturation arginine rhamnosyltransferase EarP [Burkholderiales bacterium]|nr:elongation factor P maturation arginine rhamnosyltransferase EarP [Burkholderiales bacterium]
MAAANSIPPTWDIFCKVVDNFGDAGVCWRLANILHREHGLNVRLWIDDLPTLRALHPALDATVPLQQVDGITVCCWQGAAPLPGDAAVVVEAFGCGLPEGYVAAMAAKPRPPLWIVLEYLSAETWVDQHHGLSSPHPRLPLPRYFFFPGFTSATGGLLREADLLSRRAAFDAAAFWHEMDFADNAETVLTVSLFAYADAPVAELLAAMAQGAEPVLVAVPGPALLPAVQAFFGVTADDRGPWRRGALEARALPFLSQMRYDELLWACDLNFVRGEDSFVRAQWAARPLVWQAYRQDEGAHQRKLQAFLDRYCTGLAPSAAAALGGFWRCWNGDAAGLGAAWPALRAAQAEIGRHAERWTRDLAAHADMARQLVGFAANRVK